MMILNCAQLYARYRYAPRARAVPAGHESGCIPPPWYGTSPHRSITHNANSTLGVLVGQAHTTDHHYSAGSIYHRPAMSDYRQAWRRPKRMSLTSRQHEKTVRVGLTDSEPPPVHVSVFNKLRRTVHVDLAELGGGRVPRASAVRAASVR